MPSAAPYPVDPAEALPPSVRRVLAMVAAMPVEKGTAEELGVEQARARTRSIWAGYWSAELARIDHVSDHTIRTAQGEVPARLYAPASNRTRPLIYVHGGGFVLGDLDTHDVIPRHLALYSGRPVISLGYRLAPEHPYPAPLLDIVAATEAIARGDSGLDVDPAGFTLGGDSAGANLALGAAIRLRGTANAPSGLVLLFGCYDPAVGGASALAYGSGFGLAVSDVAWFWRQYLGDKIGAPPPDAAPLTADLSRLPPVYLGVPACDPLRSDSEALRDRLVAVGARPEFRLWPGMIHGCIGMVRELNEAHAQFADVATWVAQR